MGDKSKSIKVILPPALGCYVHLFKPHAFEDEPPKYSLALLWDKADAPKLLAEFNKAIQAAAVQKFGPKAIEMLKKGIIAGPLRDGDAERSEDPTYAGKVFINAKSDRPPGIVNTRREPVIEETDCYSGCTFRASVAVWPFETKGNKGVTAFLNAVQVVEKGERLAGNAVDAAEEFSDFMEEGEAEPAPLPKSKARAPVDLDDIE